MARINLEDQLFNDGRFKQLEAIKGVIMAQGMIVQAFKLAQMYWTKKDAQRSSIPKAVFLALPEMQLIIDVGLAHEKEDGTVYVSGTEEAFEWVLKRTENGTKGGRPRGKKSDLETKAKPKRNLNITKAKPTDNPQSQSQSQSQSSSCEVLECFEPEVTREYVSNVKPKTQRAWFQTLPDETYVVDEINAACHWLTTKPDGHIKTYGSFFSGWLKRSWARHRENKNILNINQQEHQEALARIVALSEAASA